MAPPAPHKGGDGEKRHNPFAILSGIPLSGLFLTDMVNHIGEHGSDMLIAHHIKHLPPATIRL